ncbi:MAG: hypothetical protein KH828_02700 [Clostridiales bacterium]|nr:hypothetical protein [Clostridiales bacterium]
MRKNNDEYYTTKNMVRKKFLRLTIRVFFGLLLAVGLLGLIIPLRPKQSDVEKRELTKFPKPTVSTFLNGEFFNGISTWYADTFPFREGLMTANSKFKKLYGITTTELHGEVVEADEIPDADAEITSTPIPTAEPTPEPDGTLYAEPEKAGTIYVADNRGFELYGFSRDGADAYINMINSAAEQLKDIATVYDILAPTSIAVNLAPENQEKIGSSDQEKVFDYVFGHLDSSIKKVEILETLRKHNSEYLYFKTDHHWTADGAYYAYQELMNAKGQTPAPLSSYTKNEYDGFVGSFYTYSGKSDTLKNNPDTLVTYTPAVNTMTYTDSKNQEIEGQVVADPTSYSAANKYLCFIAGDQPYSKIENPNITDGSSCVVVKESYGNAFVPFLVNSYQTVHVVDYRHFKGNLISLVREKGIKDVIFLNNSNALIQSAVKNMSRITVPPATPTPTPTPTVTPSATPSATPSVTPTTEP